METGAAEHGIPDAVRESIEHGTIVLAHNGHHVEYYEDEVGGRTYVSDEVGGGMIVFQTSLTSLATLAAVLAKEMELRELEVLLAARDQRGEALFNDKD